MADDARVPSLSEQVRALQDIIDGIDARTEDALTLARDTRERLQDVARLASIVTQAPGDPRDTPRHAAPKRDRSHLKLLPGGLAAFAPVAVAFHEGLPAAAVTGWQWLWRAQRNHARWAAAALLLGVAGAAVPVAAAPDPPHPHAVDCPAPRPHHPRADHDRDDRDVIARLPVRCHPPGGTIGG